MAPPRHLHEVSSRGNFGMLLLRLLFTGAVAPFLNQSIDHIKKPGHHYRIKTLTRIIEFMTDNAKELTGVSPFIVHGSVQLDGALLRDNRQSAFIGKESQDFILFG